MDELRSVIEVLEPESSEVDRQNTARFENVSLELCVDRVDAEKRRVLMLEPDERSAIMNDASSNLLSDSVKAWCESLSLHDHLAKTLLDLGLHGASSTDPLVQISHLQESEIRSVCESFQLVLINLLTGNVEKLKNAVDAYTKCVSIDIGDKFSISSEMECGKIDDFHKGLTGRIGIDTTCFKRQIFECLRLRVHVNLQFS